MEEVEEVEGEMGERQAHSVQLYRNTSSVMSDIFALSFLYKCFYMVPILLPVSVPIS